MIIEGVYEVAEKDLMEHCLHKIVVVRYKSEEIAIECETCMATLVSFTKGEGE
jgi:ribosomal protein S27E